ncbi:hypothetical protein BVI1335_1290031 [Burkholderia vietnamiensis]|nr:hypothetical protein BVI1335_1290031 [Burkholderia vietnamiensis]
MSNTCRNRTNVGALARCRSAAHPPQKRRGFAALKALSDRATGAPMFALDEKKPERLVRA